MTYTADRLAAGHVLITWSHASAHCIQLYREVGTNGPTDKGSILAHRELPLTATAAEVKAVQAELSALA